MSKDLNVHYMHNTDDWRTPSKLYDFFVNVLGRKDLFPYKCDYDQYEKHYIRSKLFCNPPYSDMKRVTEYLLNLVACDNDILLLIPSRTDTKYFEELLTCCDFIWFITGRLHFNDSDKVAPFPSLILHLKAHKENYFTKCCCGSVDALIDFGEYLW